VGTIAVCDTEPIAIEGLRSLLDSAEGLRVVAAETSLFEGVDTARHLLPSIMIVDKAFGMHAVMDCLSTLHKMDAPTSVVVWGSTVAEPEALHFLQAGAAGVIRKTATLESLLSCLRAVSAGTTWIERDLFEESTHTEHRSRSALTARELQVMELVERGLKNRDIGTTLGIRTGTVKIHMKHIFEKTGIRGRYGLALSGLKQKGLLTEGLTEVQ
jgi:two-component system, NarL family, nitrate/nitrite response regulator NarL